MEYPFFGHSYQHLYAYNHPGTQAESSPVTSPSTSTDAIDLSESKETVTLSVKVVNPSKKSYFEEC